MTCREVALRPAPVADRGRALARVPSDIMAALDIEAGDAVCLSSTSHTYCRAVRAPAGSEDVDVDPHVADRIGAAWGETVRLSRAELAPLSTALVSIGGTAVGLKPADVSEALFDLPITCGDSFDLPLPMGRRIQIKVAETSPAEAGFFTSDTILTIANPSTPAQVYEEIGGLEEQIARVEEMVTTPLSRPELFDSLGVPPPRGILFTGPPGSGKTLLARAVAARTSATFFHLNAPEIVSKHYGDSEAALRQVFDAAARKAPSIVFIDEIDAIAPRRDALSGEKQVERRVVAQLLTLLDGLSDRGRVVVMAATNLPDAIDPALRRPGRLEREIIFRPPNRAERRAILDVHLAGAPLGEDADLEEVAERTQGYVGADLAALAREAALAALSRGIADAGGEADVDPSELCVTARDLDHGISVTRPALLRDAVVESPTIGWADIGGHGAIKSTLEEAILLPVRHRESFRSLGVPPARGILISGPPGSGKTLLARGLAGESGLNFIGVRPTRILSQYLGEAERAVAELFAKARLTAPCILFFDEFDALARRRTGQDAPLERIVAQLLVEMDGMSPNQDVIVLAATNRPSAIDPALLRPGRIDQIIDVPLPDPEAREAILTVHLKGRAQATDISLAPLVAETEGMSGADLAALAEAAARAALRRHLSEPGVPAAIEQRDLEEALANMRGRRIALAADHLDMKGAEADA